MNYLPFVGWGFYGASSARERATFFASWGMMAALPAIVNTLMPIIAAYYRRLRG